MTWIPGLYASPFRYPGGKGKIANFVKLLMLENGLVGRDYVEPYAGGASVALTLLFEDYADRIHINDLNPGIHAFWDLALNATSELCERIDHTPVTMREWERQRKIITSREEVDPFDLGFATFFLNRTNRSGIISGGVIGGRGQRGQWKLDARFNKTDLTQRIRKIGRHRSRIVLTQMDAVEFLEPWGRSDAMPCSFLYLDPPYFVKGAGLYDNFYGADDHAHVSAKVNDLQHPWIVSYDAVPEIIALYEQSNCIRYSLTYSAQTRGIGSEVMFFSDDLDRPEISPNAVSSNIVYDARSAAG